MKFRMTDCKSMPTLMVMNLKKLSETSSDSGETDQHLYRQSIESLMYLVNTKPDICYAVSVLSQFMSQPRKTQWIAAKHVLRYLQGTVGYALRYSSGVDMELKDMPMQIGQGAEWTGRAPSVVVLLWDLPWFPSATGNRLMWL
jgi:hypothetical protein